MLDSPVGRRDRPAVAAAVLLLAASLAPMPESGGPSLAPLGVALDKWVHALSYAALTGLLAWGRRTRTAAAVAVLAAVAVGYGAGVELLQGLVPSRGTSGLDLLANAVGAVLGGVGWLTVHERLAGET